MEDTSGFAGLSNFFDQNANANSGSSSNGIAGVNSIGQTLGINPNDIAASAARPSSYQQITQQMQQHHDPMPMYQNQMNLASAVPANATATAMHNHNPYTFAGMTSPQSVSQPYQDGNFAQYLSSLNQSQSSAQPNQPQMDPATLAMYMQQMQQQQQQPAQLPPMPMIGGKPNPFFFQQMNQNRNSR